MDRFYESPAALNCRPDKSAHISAHNAVRVEKLYNHSKKVHEAKLEEAYLKAQKRAAKKGRKLPARDEYYNHWGYTYYMYGPWMAPMYYSPGVYYAGTPGDVCSHEGFANCAQGTCGNNTTIAAGACGQPGGCTSVSTGVISLFPVPCSRP
jgi:hypothetical protein